MPFTLAGFAAKRPYLIHLTARENLEFLAHHRALFPVGDLLEKAGVSSQSREKRRQHLEIMVDGRNLKIRDQAPLHEGNMALDGSWSFADFIAHLNTRVFFWPGRRDGLPIDYGMRHYERYAGESPAILRISTAQLFDSNPARA